MPRWLAPNVITLLGIIAIYINILTILYYIPDLVGPGPSWIYYSFAFGLFFYQTMDNIDGKQARATGSSSPLGELFDHGIDSLNCCLGGLVQSACLGMGSTPGAAALTFITCIAMYLSTWETYHTHVLYLGYLNGPTEGIIIAVLVMIISAVYGIEFWNTPLLGFSLIPTWVSKYIISLFMTVDRTTTLKDLWVGIAIVGVALGHVPVCLYNVYQAKLKDCNNNKTEAMQKFLATLPELFPIIAFMSSIYLWLSSPYSTILSHNHLVLFTLTMSLVFGRMTTTIILAHLTKQHKFPYWSTPMYPLFFGSFLFRFFRWPTGTTVSVSGLDSPKVIEKLVERGVKAVTDFGGNTGLSVGSLVEASVKSEAVENNYMFSVNFELIYLWSYFLLLLIYFSVYSSRVIKAITGFLGISAFTVKKPIDLMSKDS